MGHWWTGRAGRKGPSASLLLPALTSVGSPGLEMQHQAWTLIFMDQTAFSGHSLLQLSGPTLETIYSPKAPGTSGSVTLVTLKSPWGLAILENIFN